MSDSQCSEIVQRGLVGLSRDDLVSLMYSELDLIVLSKEIESAMPQFWIQFVNEHSRSLAENMLSFEGQWPLYLDEGELEPQGTEPEVVESIADPVCRKATKEQLDADESFSLQASDTPQSKPRTDLQAPIKLGALEFVAANKRVYVCSDIEDSGFQIRLGGKTFYCRKHGDGRHLVEGLSTVLFKQYRKAVERGDENVPEIIP